MHLIRIGLDQIVGYLDFSVEGWKSAGLATGSLDTISVQSAASRLGEREKPFLLDIRTDSEWKTAHIEGATHIFLGFLEKQVSELPKNKPILMICGSGYRSSIAGSILERHAFDRLTSIAGGMDAWLAAGLPVAR